MASSYNSSITKADTSHLFLASSALSIFFFLKCCLNLSHRCRPCSWCLFRVENQLIVFGRLFDPKKVFFFSRLFHKTFFLSVLRSVKPAVCRCRVLRFCSWIQFPIFKFPNQIVFQPFWKLKSVGARTHTSRLFIRKDFCFWAKFVNTFANISRTDAHTHKLIIIYSAQLFSRLTSARVFLNCSLTWFFLQLTVVSSLSSLFRRRDRLSGGSSLCSLDYHLSKQTSHHFFSNGSCIDCFFIFFLS